METGKHMEPVKEIDLFEFPDLIPAPVQEVLNNIQDDNWGEMDKALEALRPLGYTFDYDLGSAIYNLRKL